MTDVPLYEVTNQCGQSHMHPTTGTDFFSLHQRLAFPCVWVSTMHGTDVPTPPQLSQLPKESESEIMPQVDSGMGIHPMSGQQDFPGVDQWEVLTSPMDIHKSIH